MDPAKPWTIPNDVKLGELPGKLDLNAPRYNQEEYWGRVRHFIDVTDVRTLLTTDAQLEAARDLVSKYKGGQPLPDTTVGELYAAQKIVNAIIHPGTLC